MAKIKNLDKLIPEDRYIILGGLRYTIPGKISVEKVLELSQLGSEVQKDALKFKDVLDKIWSILLPFNSDKIKENFTGSLTIPMLAELLSFVFSDTGGEDEITGVHDGRGEESGPVATP
jgi:hypothetical protein